MRTAKHDPQQTFDISSLSKITFSPQTLRTQRGVAATKMKTLLHLSIMVKVVRRVGATLVALQKGG